MVKTGPRSMKKPTVRAVLLIAAALVICAPQVVDTARQASRATVTSLQFEVTVADGLIEVPQSGRLFVILNPNSSPEPRRALGRTGINAPPVFATDVDNFAPGIHGVIDRTSAAFPIDSLADVPAGDYFIQALFASNMDLKSPNAPGNLYSEVRRLSVNPARSTTIRIELTKRVPPEQLPMDTDYLRFVKIQSDLLTTFHGRPIYLRAGIILPRDYDHEPTRRYPLRVHIGGYGERFTRVRRMMAGGSEFRRTWLAEDTPRMILLHLDGAGPYGDPYQVNSANNGPYGDAVTRELIPYVERRFRAVGEPYARVLDGQSTGGWVSLALQVFYPEFFSGAWSACPDSVDFRAFQLVNIYEDANAYVNDRGFERTSARDINGDVRFNMRHESQMENVLGLGDSWTMSGMQWGAWNAAYGPRGSDGRPRPLWDPKTGVIDHGVVDHWAQYDLRLVLERSWRALGPVLQGKIHIWVGEADNYFLNDAVHLLDDFLSRAEPPYGGQIAYGSGRGHCWLGVSPRELMDQMAATIRASRASAAGGAGWGG